MKVRIRKDCIEDFKFSNLTEKVIDLGSLMFEIRLVRNNREMLSRIVSSYIIMLSVCLSVTGSGVKGHRTTKS